MDDSGSGERMSEGGYSFVPNRYSRVQSTLTINHVIYTYYGRDREGERDQVNLQLHSVWHLRCCLRLCMSVVQFNQLPSDERQKYY